MNYSKVNLFDIANGPGIRVSLFVSGCQFNCKGCFNQCAHDYNYGKEYNVEIKEMILKRLEHPDFQGLSILGGDPLWQDEEGLKQLISLCNEVHSMGKDVWIWTGFTWEEIFKDLGHINFLRKELVYNCDYLIEGRFEEDKKDLSLAWRGSKNQRIIDVKKSNANTIIEKVDF